MVRTLRVYLLLSSVLIGLLFPEFRTAAQDSFRIGVVDTDKVLESYKKAQEALEFLKGAEDRLRSQLDEIQEEVRTMQERLTKQKLFLDEPATATLENDIRLKQQEFQRELEIGQESLLEKQKELVEPIYNEIRELIQQIGKSEGYSLIIGKGMVALYVDPKYDLTDMVLKVLNERYDQEKSKSEKKDVRESAASPNNESPKKED